MNLTNGERDLRMIPQTRRTERKKKKDDNTITQTHTQAVATVLKSAGAHERVNLSFSH